jgi:hypothetical protein
MSLATAARANNLSQLNTVTEIKYSGRNSIDSDHSMIDVRGELQFTVLRGVLARYTLDKFAQPDLARGPRTSTRTMHV